MSEYRKRLSPSSCGRFGMSARGVIFLVIGWFVVQAGIHHDPAQAQGFSGAFLFLLAQPFGRSRAGHRGAGIRGAWPALLRMCALDPADGPSSA